LLTSAQCRPHWRQERSRSAPTKKCRLAALLTLLILLALGAPTRADDPIAEWLKQDEAGGQVDEVRPDLNALTEQQLQEIFKVAHKHADGPQRIEFGGEERTRVLFIWLVAMAAGLGAVIGAVKAAPLVRSQLRALAMPVQMKDRS
jgi:hypothetical protein